MRKQKEAETHLPELEARDGISIPMEDIGTSRVWNMRYRYIYYTYIIYLWMVVLYVVYNRNYIIILKYICFVQVLDKQQKQDVCS